MMIKSSLTNYVRQAHSNNYTSGRCGCNITHITLHHCANGNNSFPIESLGELWANPNRAGSSHYGVGTDGRIGQYVSESDIAWTDGNWDSNCHAVTIEIENCSGAPEWKISDNALKSVIKLCADIAVRNNLGILKRGQNLGWHKLYSNVTTCPEQYVMSKIDYIIEEANKLIKPIEYEKIERVTMYINKENASLWDLSFTEWDNAKSVMTYPKGTKIENLVAKYHHPLGGDYLLTEYSINNHIHNGFNIKDLSPLEEENNENSINIPTPTETPLETPKNEYRYEIWTDKKKIELIKDTSLYNYETNEVIKNYKQGSTIKNIIGICYTKNEKYYITEYSFNNSKNTGFKIEECNLYEYETIDIYPKLEKDTLINLIRKIIEIIKKILKVGE